MPRSLQVAVVDFGLGNIFSVHQALERAGAEVVVAEDPSVFKTVDAVVLPGVGAFARAMEALRSRGFIEPLRCWAAADRPLLGVCLGMQLLMGGSEEFGFHPGLDVFPGRVIRFESPRDPRGGHLKVPQVGWNTIHPDRRNSDLWAGTPLEGLSDGTWMYFVHSFHVLPDEADLSLSISSYGQIRFCSSLRRGNVFACQYHPERSGPAGLEVYRRFAALAWDFMTRSNDANGHPRQI